MAKFLCKTFANGQAVGLLKFMCFQIGGKIIRRDCGAQNKPEIHCIDLVVWVAARKQSATECAAAFGACGAFTYQAAHFYEVEHYTLWYSLRVLFSFFFLPSVQGGNEIS
jgi:hypothetical protein